MDGTVTTAGPAICQCILAEPSFNIRAESKLSRFRQLTITLYYV